MKILIAKVNPGEAEELSEYFQGNSCEVFIASEQRLVYQLLAAKAIDAVLYNVSSLDDFAVIRYINATYPMIKVVITTDASFGANIDNVRKGAFTTLTPHYHLNQLQEIILADSAKTASKPGSQN